MPKRTFIESLNDAVEGFVHVVKHERNMRIHFLIGFLVLVAALIVGVSRLEWIILCCAVSFVLVAEMVNSVVEEIVDIVHEEFHPAARLIKDMSAGVVLLSVLNAIVVGVLVFSKYWSRPLAIFAFRIRFTPWHIMLVSLLAVIFLVVLTKAFFRRGTPLRGGPISGHAAIAFSLWTSVLFTQTNIYVIFATLLLAILVVQCRVGSKIHTTLEALIGAAVGVLITSLFFKIFIS